MVNDFFHALFENAQQNVTHAPVQKWDAEFDPSLQLFVSKLF
jgi:hypothetical protein